MASKSKYSSAVKMAKQVGWSEEKFDLVLSRAFEDVSDAELASFIYQCDRTGLDPLSNQIYLVGRWDKRFGRNVGAVQTGIDGYRLIADRTGAYAGNDDPLFDNGQTQYEMVKEGRKNPSSATVSVYKLVGNHVGKFTATALWDSYAPTGGNDFMWKKMPYLMLGKVAEALALRKAFPAELSGIYTSEEMMQAGDTVAPIPGFEDSDAPLNKNANRVLDKFEDAGIAVDDPSIMELTGGVEIKKIANDGAGTDLLKKLWGVATRVKKGAELSDAIAEVFAGGNDD